MGRETFGPSPLLGKGWDGVFVKECLVENPFEKAPLLNRETINRSSLISLARF